jgi:hypothetical protein
MSDTCEVYLLDPADKDLEKIKRKAPERAIFIQEAIAMVEENGWILSTRSQLIKELRTKDQIGEIRDVGSGGYRLFFFWSIEETVRKLFITAVVKKSDVVAKVRLNTYLDAAKKMRDRYLNQD